MDRIGERGRKQVSWVLSPEELRRFYDYITSDATPGYVLRDMLAMADNPPRKAHMVDLLPMDELELRQDLAATVLRQIRETEDIYDFHFTRVQFMAFMAMPLDDLQENARQATTVETIGMLRSLERLGNLIGICKPATRKRIYYTGWVV